MRKLSALKRFSLLLEALERVGGQIMEKSQVWNFLGGNLLSIGQVTVIDLLTFCLIMNLSPAI